MPSAILVDALSKRYGATIAVDDVTIAVPAGTVFALLGPNGAGKTTTVECLAGFRRPDAGSVRILGADPIAERDTVTSALGLMLQEGGAYQAATPREMLDLYARFYPDPLDPLALLERVSLSEKATTRYRALSGGQKQRLNLALALVGRPRVLILDEPTAGMDPAVRRDVWALIAELRQDGVAVLLCTHVLEEAARLADVVGVLDRGRLVACDAPARLAAASASSRLLVTSSVVIDEHALSAALGAPIHAEGPGRWIVEAGEESVPAVAAWFSAHGLPLSGVTVQDSLEDAYLRLTSGSAQ